MPNVPFIQRKDNFFLIRRVLVPRLTMDYIYLGLTCWLDYLYKVR